MLNGNLAIPHDAQARQKIMDLQNAMGAGISDGSLQEIEFPITHYFAPGLYIREMFIPAGSAVVGKIHKHAHFNDISKGRVRVFTEFGFDIYEAPCRFVSEAGTKRCVMAETDTVWTTFHPTDKTDPDEIVEDVTAKDYDELAALSYTDIKGLIA